MREGLAGRTGAGEHLKGTGWGDPHSVSVPGGRI
jgi:hypothetical protein